MKTYLVTAALAVGLVAASQAESQMYGELFGGVNLAPDLEFQSSDYEMDTGYNFGASLGWNLGANWSVEGEVTYNKNEYSCCTPNSASLLNLSVNGYYTFQTAGSFKPYVGVGIGYGDLTYDNGSEFSDWVFTYQAIAGGRFAVTDTTDLFAEYRYVASDDASDSGTVWEYRAHVLSAGLRVNF